MNRDLDEIKASLVVMIDTSNEKLEEKEKVRVALCRRKRAVCL